VHQPSWTGRSCGQDSNRAHAKQQQQQQQQPSDVLEAATAPSHTSSYHIVHVLRAVPVQDLALVQVLERQEQLHAHGGHLGILKALALRLPCLDLRLQGALRA
jgi:hypothetical protein